MKKLTIAIAFSLFVFAVILGSCGGSGSGPSASGPVVSEDNTTMTVGSAGVKINHDNELETSFNGLAFENVIIVDGNDKKISTTEVALNTTFSIVYEGIKNYTLKGGNAFPNLSILVMDNNQQPVISEDDLLASYADGHSVADASVLRASITVGDPMKPGKYICRVMVVDKNNSDAAIVSTWSFEVK